MPSENAIWEEAHLKALLQLSHSPLHLIQAPPWDDWIQQHGGLKAVYTYLLNLEELAEDQRRLLQVILAHPQQTADYYADASHISRKTYFRALSKLLPVLERSLNGWSPPVLILPRAPVSNLPAPVTSFIGREKEIAETKRLLSEARLVTLTGPGGTGKTRLSLEVAAALLELFSDGVWFIELAPLSDPRLVPQKVATTLGVQATAGRPITETLKDYLRVKADSLLLLDNCEHLVEACAELADSLLQGCPRLHLLASSREALGIAGEIPFRVPSLSLPDLKKLPLVEGVTEYEAVQLFVERAGAALPGFRLTSQNAPAVAQICHQLDGIPLALELAAARVKVLNVEQIAIRLDDRFRLLTGGSRTALPRQQTLRALIDWSYDLLSEPERVLLQRLAVFAGGWTLEAAEAVCVNRDEGGRLNLTRSVQPSDVLDLLTQLINKSLVVVEREPGLEVRYRLLETIRQYAWEKLLESGEAEKVRDQHLEFCLKLVEETEPRLFGAQQTAGLEQLAQEHDNLRAALEWSLEEKTRAEAGLRLVGALWFFWYRRGYWHEGREWADKTLAVEVAGPSAACMLSQAKALCGAGWLAGFQGDQEQAITFSEQSITLFKALGSAGKRGMALALKNLGYVSDKVGPLEESLALFREIEDGWGVAEALSLLANNVNYQRGLELNQESLAIRRKIGDKDGIAWSLFQIGRIIVFQEDYERAVVLLEESLALFQEVSSKYGIAYSLLELGQVAWFQGNYERAQTLLEESHLLFKELGDRRREAPIFLGLLAQEQGDSKQAIKWIEEGLASYQKVREQWGIPWASRQLGKVMLAQHSVKQAAKLYKESLVLYQALRSVSEWASRYQIIFCLAGLAGMANLQRQVKRAARLLGAAKAHLEALETTGVLVWFPDRAHYQQTLTTVRAESDEATFSVAWAEGQAMTLEQAVAYALIEDEG